MCLEIILRHELDGVGGHHRKITCSSELQRRIHTGVIAVNTLNLQIEGIREIPVPGLRQRCRAFAIALQYRLADIAKRRAR